MTAPSSPSSVRGERGMTLRAQILVMLLAGGIIPLAIVGIWLSSAATRAGEQLLRGHLRESADRFVAAVNKRWEWRQSDIGWLANNESSLRVLGGASLSDSVFLNGIADTLAATIPSVELRSSEGVLRWRSTPGMRAAAIRARRADSGRVAPAPVTGPTLRVDAPVVDAEMRPVGNAVAFVSLSALVPPDSARPLVPGARLGMRGDGSSPSLLMALHPRASFPEGDKLDIGGETWLVEHRTLVEPAISIVIAAPLSQYVSPFAHAAKQGIVALLAVAFLAVLLTAILASRATRPLEELAVASDAVAHGQLGRRVQPGGPAEVRRVAGAFNVMTDNLRATLDALTRRSALAAVGEFATSLSHDVRNALTAIKVDLERIKKRKLVDPAGEDLLERALASVLRLEGSVTGALRVARRGQAPLSDIDLRDPVEAAVKNVSGTFAALPAIVESDLPSEPVTVNGDAAALTQLFSNLLFNAAQALPPRGGVSRIVVGSDGGNVEVLVSDNGTGISAEEMSRLETAFYSSKPNGTGLGLPIARQIVAAHGGSLAIDSMAGKGTTVRVRLPGVNRSKGPVEQSIPNEGPNEDALQTHKG